MNENKFASLKLVHLVALLICGLFLAEAGGRFYDFKRKKKVYQHSGKISADLTTVTYQKIDFLVRKPKGTYRIIILGGSAAEGFGNQAFKSWGHRVKQRIQTLLPRGEINNIEMINMAQGAQISVDDLVKLVHEGLPLQPDAVIYYGGWNDIAAYVGNPGWTVQNTQTQLSRIGDRVESYSFKKRMQIRFFLVRKFFRVKGDLESFISELYAKILGIRSALETRMSSFFPRNEVAQLFNPLHDTKKSIPPFESIERGNHDVGENYYNLYEYYPEKFKAIYEEYFKSNLEALAATLRMHRVEGFFVFQPDLLYIAESHALSPESVIVSKRLMTHNTEFWRKVIHDCYPTGISIMRKISKANKIHFLNLSVLAAQEYSEVFIDNVHYTEQGNRLIADLLLQHFQSEIIQAIDDSQGGANDAV